LPPTDRARVYDALEAVIATEAGNGQLQSGVWQTLRNITGQTLSSRTLLGRFVVTTRHLRQSWLTVVVKLYPLEPFPNLTRNLQMPKGNRGSAIRHDRGNH
jgi:hypothetical protein